MTNQSDVCPMGTKKKKGLSQCGEAQKGLEESEEKEVLVVNMVSFKAEIFNSSIDKENSM